MGFAARRASRRHQKSTCWLAELRRPFGDVHVHGRQDGGGLRRLAHACSRVQTSTGRGWGAVQAGKGKAQDFEVRTAYMPGPSLLKFQKKKNALGA